MAAHGGNAPIIIKRKRNIVGGGHHGGAWKVAYADFVTAMMAFFMLMWLLGSTTEDQRKGIADYFAPTAPLSRTSGGSDGLFGGNNPNSVSPQAEVGDSAATGLAGDSEYQQSTEAEGTAAQYAAESAALEELEDAFLGRGGESLISNMALRHVVTRMTDEGLILEIFSLPGAPIFNGNTAEPMAVTREIIASIAQLSGLVTNPLAIGAHVPAQPVVLATNPVWPMSTDRADAIRGLLVDSGLAADRLRRITGHADRSPAVENPMSERNDRIEIILLRNRY